MFPLIRFYFIVWPGEFKKIREVINIGWRRSPIYTGLLGLCNQEIKVKVYLGIEQSHESFLDEKFRFLITRNEMRVKKEDNTIGPSNFLSYPKMEARQIFFFNSQFFFFFFFIQKGSYILLKSNKMI